MAGLDTPPAPEVGAVNHFSVELVWETALKEANERNRGKGQGPVKVHLQCKDDNLGHRGDWGIVYKGMAKRFLVNELTPKSKYIFRYQFEQKGQFSEWSPTTTVLTTREPLYAENLHMAIKKKNEADLIEVLKSGEVSPDVQNEDGFTALMAAAKKPFLEGLERLLEYGADVNYKNTAGKTALMVACTSNMLESVKILRAHNADYNVYDNGGCTAVHWAVDVRDVKLIEWIAKDGADLNIKDHAHGGWTPLIRCANMHGDRDVALALMMNGADLMLTDNSGSTVLHHAVLRQHYQLTKLLLQRRADPLVPNKEKTTPWQIACSTDERRGIIALMQKAVDEINAKRKTAALQDAKANALQITTGLQKTSASVISPVQ